MTTVDKIEKMYAPKPHDFEDIKGSARRKNIQ